MSVDTSDKALDALVEHLSLICGETARFPDGSYLWKQQRNDGKPVASISPNDLVTWQATIEALRADRDEAQRELASHRTVVGALTKARETLTAERDALQEQLRWVPVSEGNPPEPDRYLIRYTYNGREVRPFVADWDGDEWASMLPPNEVTHWRYIDPPKEEGS